jgi:hypothetical protein
MAMSYLIIHWLNKYSLQIIFFALAAAEPLVVTLVNIWGRVYGQVRIIVESGLIARGQLLSVCKCVPIFKILNIPIACIGFEIEINFMYLYVNLPNTVTVTLLMALLWEFVVPTSVGEILIH